MSIARSPEIIIRISEKDAAQEVTGLSNNVKDRKTEKRVTIMAIL
jgi:hypothetical protein